MSLRLRQIRANHSNNVLKRSPWYSEIFLSPIFPELISRPCSHTSGMYYVVKSSVVASTSSGSFRCCNINSLWNLDVAVRQKAIAAKATTSTLLLEVWHGFISRSVSHQFGRESWQINLSYSSQCKQYTDLPRLSNLTLVIFGSYALHTDPKSEANLVCQSVCQCVSVSVCQCVSVSVCQCVTLRTRWHVTDLREYK